MAFTETFLQPQRWTQFHFFATGSAVTSFIAEDIALGKPWKLQEIRLHFSAAMGSVKYFTARISSIRSSMFNLQFFSEDLNGLIDYQLYYSEPLLFESDDQLVIRSSVISVALGYGLSVIGWAVLG